MFALGLILDWVLIMLGRLSDVEEAYLHRWWNLETASQDTMKFY